MKDWTNAEFKAAIAKLTQSGLTPTEQKALIDALRAIAIALVYLAEQVRWSK